MDTNVADKAPHVIRIKKELIDQEQQQHNALDREMKLKDIQIEGLRKDLMQGEGIIASLKKEYELLIKLKACKETETKILRVIFF